MSISSDRPTKILFRLCGGYGLGDTVQFVVVLKHLAKHRPHWQIDVRAQRGAVTVLRGFCHTAFHFDEPPPAYAYDKEVDLQLFEVYDRFTDRPSNKIAYCLKHTFGIDEYDHGLGRYECLVSPEAKAKAWRYLRGVSEQKWEGGFKAVILHYQGSSNHARKNLQHWQAKEICDLIRRAGRTPILFDWDKRSPLIDQKAIFNPGVGNDDIWGNTGGGDAEIIAAMISSVEAFIGVDSGPGKLASATNTPSLICWTNHHPLQYHDPAPWTWHLIPEDWEKMTPLDGNPEMAAYFDKHYDYSEYKGEHGLIAVTAAWLADVLKCEGSLDTGVTFVVPGSKEEALKCMTKVEGIAQGRPIDVVVAGIPKKEEFIDVADFVRGFTFVRSVKIEDIQLLHNTFEPKDVLGRTFYISEGLRDDGRHYLIPHATMQRGVSLDQWLPGVDTDFEVMAKHRLSGKFDNTSQDIRQSVAKLTEDCLKWA